jgi:Ca2+-binding EF-hand superfamily protein
MQKRIILTAAAIMLSLPLALSAADQKKKGPFMAADADNDGKVTQTEYVAAVKGKMDDAAAKAKFAELDKNKDGSLSREEFQAGTEKKGEKKKKTAN